MREYCRVLASPNIWEICILLETVPPSLLCLCLARTCSSPWNWGWVVLVCHANISMWSWLFYFLTYHSCPSAKQDAQLVHTGTALMVAASVICVVAAVTNDRYFPEARMSQKEAKAFFDHLKSTRPRQTVVLKHRRIGVDNPVDNWYDYTRFPDLSEVSESGDMEVKINLITEAEDDRTEQALNSFIQRTVSENGESDSHNYKLITSIPGRKIRIGPRHWNVFPAIKSDRKHRIYIFNHNKRPLIMDFFLRTAWIMNILACSGPVLAVFMSLRQRSVDCYIVKKYKVYVNNSPGHFHHHVQNEISETESIDVPAIEDYQAQTNFQEELPPSYSSLEMADMLPSYTEATSTKEEQA